MTNLTDRVEANRRALARLLAVQPAWSAVRRAREALGLPDRTLLHAGPPLHDPCRPPAPLLSSAVLCCLYEGWAANAAEAQRLIAAGTVRLRPAQDFRAVTPLAAVISPSTMLVEVCDLAGGAGRAWSLLGSGAGPQLRFGSRDPAILTRLAWRDGPLAAELARGLETGPLPLLPLAAAGLAGGDDLHARTSGANAALCRALVPRLLAGSPSANEQAQAVADMLAQTPLFFLTPWMAACHLMLDAAADAGSDPGASLVVALAGNGERVGIRLAGQPDRWHTAAAEPPAGPRLNALAAAATASPVIGDSGVIDVLGCGGQALDRAPEVVDALAPWLPADWRSRAGGLLAGSHAGLAPAGLPVGLDASAVRPDRTPLAAIAMVDAAGELGLLGRGLYLPPAALFIGAVGAVGAI